METRGRGDNETGAGNGRDGSSGRCGTTHDEPSFSSLPVAGRQTHRQREHRTGMILTDFIVNVKSLTRNSHHEGTKTRTRGTTG